MREVIQFVSEKRLFLLADEVDIFKYCCHLDTMNLKDESTNALIYSVCFLLHRSIKTMFLGKTVSLCLIRGFCLRWALLFQTQWSWRPSTQPPKA